MLRIEWSVCIYFSVLATLSSRGVLWTWSHQYSTSLGSGPSLIADTWSMPWWRYWLWSLTLWYHWACSISGPINTGWKPMLGASRAWHKGRWPTAVLAMAPWKAPCLFQADVQLGLTSRRKEVTGVWLLVQPGSCQWGKKNNLLSNRKQDYFAYPIGRL